jgi:hypothetical protein
MNTAVMSWAWKQRLPRADRRLLLILAEGADATGLIRRLTISELVVKTGLPPRNVHQGLSRLIVARVIQWLDSDCYRLNMGSDPSSPHDGTPPTPAKVASAGQTMVVYLRKLLR